VPRAGDRERLREQDERPGREEAEPERRHVEGHGARHVGHRNAPAGEHAVAHGAPAEEGEPDVVAEDVRDEGRERDARIRERPPDPAQGEGVVAGEREVAQQRERDRDGEVVARDRTQVPDHVSEVVLRELAVQDGDREREEREPEERPERGEQALPHGSAASRRRRPARMCAASAG
jgi:hypothetical protein